MRGVRCPPLIIHTYILSIFSEQHMDQVDFFFEFFLRMQPLVISSAGPKDSEFDFFKGREARHILGCRGSFMGMRKSRGHPNAGGLSSSLLYVHVHMYIRTWASPVE